MLCGELRQSRLAILIQFAEGVLLLLMREERDGLRHRDPAPLTTRQFLQRRSERVLRSPCELALIHRRRVGRVPKIFFIASPRPMKASVPSVYGVPRRKERSAQSGS